MTEQSGREPSEMVTSAQRNALSWLPGDGTYRTWAGKIMKSPNKTALKTCLRRGWAKRVGHPDMDLYAITERGRAALSDSRTDKKGER